MYLPAFDQADSFRSYTQLCQSLHALTRQVPGKKTYHKQEPSPYKLTLTNAITGNKNTLEGQHVLF